MYVLISMYSNDNSAVKIDNKVTEAFTCFTGVKRTIKWSSLDQQKNLQIFLNKLESFCENADLSVNLDKIKIMIFNSCGKSLNYLFRYGADELENLIKSYKYLGLIMSPWVLLETLISLGKSWRKLHLTHSPCIRRLSPQYDRQSKFWCPNETIR